MSVTSDTSGVAIPPADPIASIIAEFSSLAIQKGWKKNSKEYKKQRARLVADRFEVHFGSNLSALEGWQALCKTVGIAVAPSSIKQCKKLLKKVEVNIFDLIDAARSNKTARVFSSVFELAAYTKKEGKVFPKAEAKQNKLLKFMLRKIF